MDTKEFIWTDELVAEYSLHTQPLSMESFKRAKMQKKYPEGILAFKYPNGNISSKPTNYQEWVKARLSQGYDIYSAQGLVEPIIVGDNVRYKGSPENVLGWKVRQIIINQNNELIAQGSGSQCEIARDLIKISFEKTYTASEVQDLFKKFLDSIPVQLPQD